jgi:insertion element IS1 protein InsB
VNEPLIKPLKPTSVAIVQRGEEAELDEMWSFVGSQKYQRWLWHAIDHESGEILAYLLSDDKDGALGFAEGGPLGGAAACVFCGVLAE